jgi:metallo-beta-lactamase family protein
MELKFLGAAATVTGSKTLIHNHDSGYLVDCGLYQGENWLTEKNKNEIDKDIIKSLLGVFITHAHLDHCGYLPYLVAQGYSGPIFMTEETKKLVSIVLEDAYNIMEKAHLENKIEKKPYTQDDIAKVISMINLKERDILHKHENLEFKFYQAGHILGAVSLWLKWDNKKVLFTGDLGRTDDCIHPEPQVCPDDVDAVVIEGTYGDRTHPVDDSFSKFQKTINHIREKKGVLLIPSFAIARSTVVLKKLYDFFQEYPTLKLKIYVDSPMMIKALHAYEQYSKELKIKSQEFLAILGDIKMVEFPKDRKKLMKVHAPYILLSSSGMLTGGRSIEHFERIAIKDYNAVLFVGYQGVGTLGRAVIDGQNEILANNKPTALKALIENILSLSAHADQKQIIDYLMKSRIKDATIFINHAEKSAADELEQSISSKLKNRVIKVEENQNYQA